MRALEKNNIGMHCILASLYFLMLPLTISVNSAGASFLKLATIPISVFFLISLFFYKKDLQINIVHIVLGIYTVTTILTMFINPTSDSFEYVKGYFLNTALFICLSVVEYNERELKILEYVQVLLLIIITVITLCNGGSIHNRTTLEIFGQESDPNYYVGFFIFPLTVTMKKIYNSKYRIFYIIAALLAIYAVFLSGSRGGLLAILVTITAFAIIYPKKTMNKFMILICMLLSVLLLWYVIKPFLSDTVIDRMSIEAVVETGGTHRTEIWASMFDKIKNSSWEFIFGRGVGALHPMMVAGKVQLVVAHNHLIQVLHDQGIVGVIAFVLLVVCCILRCMKKRKCVAIALCGVLALSLSLSFNPSIKSLWNLIPYAAFCFPKSHIDYTKDTD